MAIKLNIANKGKSYKLEIEPIVLEGKALGDKIVGKEIKPELDGYEFEITGGSDIAGFPMSKNVEGIALKKVLLTKGWGMHSNVEGIRKRKTVRGKAISDKVSQLNLNTVKEGNKPLTEIFPEQAKSKEKKAEKQTKEENKKEAEDKNE